MHDFTAIPRASKCAGEAAACQLLARLWHRNSFFLCQMFKYINLGCLRQYLRNNVKELIIDHYSTHASGCFNSKRSSTAAG
jgi:hypothetical protein